jgi:hypothetical protein
MHPSRRDGDIWICCVKAIRKAVIRIPVKVAPIASLKANHIRIIGLQVQCIEGTILPDVGLELTAVAAEPLADVRILVNVEDIPGSDILDNICYSGEWRSVAGCALDSAGHHDTGVYPLAIGFLDE